MDPVLLTYVPAGAAVQVCVPVWLLNEPDAQGVHDRSWYDDRYVPAPDNQSVRHSTYNNLNLICAVVFIVMLSLKPASTPALAHAFVWRKAMWCRNRRASSGRMLILLTTVVDKPLTRDRFPEVNDTSAVRDRASGPALTLTINSARFTYPHLTLLVTFPRPDPTNNICPDRSIISLDGPGFRPQL